MKVPFWLKSSAAPFEVHSATAFGAEERLSRPGVDVFLSGVGLRPCVATFSFRGPCLAKR